MNRPESTVRAWIQDRMASVENQPWGPGTLALLLGGVIAVRNLLEIRVARNPVFEGLAAFVHYPLAYIAPFIALTLVLAFWGRVAPRRVARLMVLAWILTLIPPLADLLLHPGLEKPTIAYLQADPSELGRIWLRFFDPTVHLEGTTLGIRVEASLAVLLAALFVFLKANSWFRALMASVSVYVCSLFFFSLPLLVTRFFRFFFPLTTLELLFRGEGVVFRPERDTAADSVATLWLMVVLTVLGLLWRLLERSFPEERLFPAAPSERAPWSRILILASFLLCGLLSALQIHFPVPFVKTVPYDFLSPAGLILGLIALVTAVSRPSPFDAPGALLLLAGAALCAALGRSVTLCLLAAAAPWVAWGQGMIPRSWRMAYGALAMTMAGFAAFAGGYGLVVGPEGLARLPLGATGPTVGLALALGALEGTNGKKIRWWVLPLCGGCVALGGLVAGDPRLLVVFLPAGLLVGLMFWGADQSRWANTGRLLAILVLGFLAVFLTRGLLRTEFLGQKWTKEATCLPALDVARGNQFAGRGEWAAASDAYRKALNCDGNYVPALRAQALGILAFEKDRIQRAIDLLTRASQLAPDSPVELQNLGAALLQAGRSQEALVPLRRAAKLAPQNLNVAANLAQAFEDQGMKDEAVAAWQHYLDLAQDRPEEEVTIGLAHQHLQRLQKAFSSRSN